MLEIDKAIVYVITNDVLQRWLQIRRKYDAEERCGIQGICRRTAIRDENTALLKNSTNSLSFSNALGMSDSYWPRASPMLSPLPPFTE